jgi:hypothetical protein
MRVDSVIETFRRILRLSATWSTLQAVIVSLDVQMFFDSIRRALLALAMLQRGVPTFLIAAVMEELVGIVADMSATGLGTTQPFPFQKGGRRGRVDTPPIANMFVYSLLGPPVDKRQSMGYGFSVDGSSLIQHLVWADNLYVVASSAEQAAEMVRELTAVMCDAGFVWKLNSLQALFSEGMAARDMPVYVDGVVIQHTCS